MQMKRRNSGQVERWDAWTFGGWGVGGWGERVNFGTGEHIDLRPTCL